MKNNWVIFEPKLFLYKYPNIVTLSYYSYLPTYEDGRERVFRNILALSLIFVPCIIRRSENNQHMH
jgi:hypothetical protein